VDAFGKAVQEKTLQPLAEKRDERIKELEQTAENTIQDFLIIDSPMEFNFETHHSNCLTVLGLPLQTCLILAIALNGLITRGGKECTRSNSRDNTLKPWFQRS
jgi:hypothetical protein